MSFTRSLAFSILTVMCGCATARSTQPALRAANERSNTNWRVSEDPLSLSMRAIAAQLEGAGLKPAEEVFRGFLTAGARATHGIELPAKSCVTLIAIASHGVHDMDAALYSPDGDLLAVDSQPDPHPTIQVCTGAEAHTLYYALQVYEGAGSFLMAGFLGQQSTLDAAAKLLGARPAIARLAPTEPEGPGRVSAFRDGLQRRGFQPLQPPLRVPLVQDQSIRVGLHVDPGQCYTAAGFALEGLQNVDLRVLDDEGTVVARDASDEEDAGAQFCAERRAEYAAELRGAAGTGTALLMMFKVDAATVGGQSGLWLGERPLARAASTALPELLAQANRSAAQDGFKPLRTLRPVRVAPGQVIAQSLTLAGRRCTRIQAVGGPGLRRLGLLAAEPNGHPVATTEGDADSTYLHLCSTAPREITLQIHAAAGSGELALALSEAPLSAVVPAGADEQLGADLHQRVREARDLGYHPHSELKNGPRHLALRGSEPLVITLAPDAARCVRAFVLSQPRNTHTQLSAAGKLLDGPADDGQPTRLCAATDQKELLGPVELRVTSDGDASDAWLMVLVR